MSLVDAHSDGIVSGYVRLVRFSLLLLLALSKAAESSKLYMNQFAVHIPAGDEHADRIASEHGFTNLGQIGALKGYYLLQHNKVHKRSVSHSQEHHDKLSNEPHVVWFEQQREKVRKKRDEYGNSFWSEFGSFIGQDHRGRQHHHQGSGQVSFPDPLYKEEWYLNGGAKDGYDMNVGPAWARGYTGKGVVVSILDDGIQTNHPDLAQNYDPLASTDINDNDNDPMPRDNGDNKHGTRCAGEVAAVAYNNFCGIGVAYNASIGGVRMLDGSVNDAVEAKALSLNPDHIDIYSASWGPEDDGKTVDGPGPLARRAFINGVTTGRRGKGSIFVWASGNGGRHTDSCNCDGYTNSIFTLSISSATQGGYKPWYLEECSSTLATTYSSGTPGHDKSIATVDMDGKLRPDHICTVEHTGTSASAPLAAGLCALALEANPNLSWRDMQHIVVMTSKPQPLMKEDGWVKNGVNRQVSHKFGYGLMDGGAMVALAEQWTTVPPQHICKSQELIEDRAIDPSYGSVMAVVVDATGCKDTVNEVRYVEHVQCKVSLRFFPRGNLRLVLTSPQGTPSTLLLERPRDVVSSNFDDWPFLSVHFWGENPRGRWMLQVFNAGNRHVNQPGILRKWQLIFYGTSSEPVKLRSAPSLPAAQPAVFSFPSAEPASPSFFPSVSSQDFFSQSTFRNLPTLFSGAGSQQQKTYLKPEDETRVMLDQNELEEKCHESCLTCVGPSPDGCLTCAKDHFYVTDLGLCLQHCPDGYYEDVERRTCVGCEGACMSCPEGPNKCAACDHHLILYNNTCVVSCPTQTYETNDYRCEECAEGCRTCRDRDSCLTCEPDGVIAAPGGLCPGLPCPQHCTACSEPGICHSCTTGYQPSLDRSHCVISNSTCRPGEKMEDGRCEACEDKESCTSCPPGFLLINFSCVTSCPQGWYNDAGWCRECTVDGCVECFGPSDCLTCASELKLLGGQCLASCPSHTFQNSQGTCSRCHHFCHECSAEGPYSCLSCSAGRFLDVAAKLCMPCQPCNATNQHQCCQCDPNTGLCHLPAGKRRISVAPDDMMAESSQLRESLAMLPSDSRTNPSSAVHGLTSFTTVAMGACAALLVSSAIVFTVLQVRWWVRSRKLGYTKVPIYEVGFTDPLSFQKTSLNNTSINDLRETQHHPLT